jgi:hypothetical protein
MGALQLSSAEDKLWKFQYFFFLSLFAISEKAHRGVLLDVLFDAVI